MKSRSLLLATGALHGAMLFPSTGSAQIGGMIRNAVNNAAQNCVQNRSRSTPVDIGTTAIVLSASTSRVGREIWRCNRSMIVRMNIGAIASG